MKLLKFQQRNGLVGYELYNIFSKIHKSYDTIRVKISNEPLNVNGKEVYKLGVSWFGSSWTILDGYEDRAFRETVYAEIDLEKFQNNAEYLRYTLNELLDRSRVGRYLKISEKTIPEINDEIARTGNNRIYPCGRYVGGVKETEDGFSKVFDPEVGRYCHELPEMQQEREEKRNLRIERQQEEIARRRAEIDGKKAELARLEAEFGNDNDGR